MVQNDEDQNDVVEKTAQAERKVAETVAPESLEDEVKTAVKRKLISVATLKEVVKQIQELEHKAVNNPHAREAIKLQAYNLVLAALAVAEVVPGIEAVNDLTKIAAIAQKTAKQGKEKGFFAELYKNVPPKLMTFIEATDLVNVPGAPIIPELIQSTVNQFKFYKEGLLFSRDLAIDAFARFKNLSQPSIEVQRAKLQFSIGK